MRHVCLFRGVGGCCCRGGWFIVAAWGCCCRGGVVCRGVVGAVMDFYILIKSLSLYPSWEPMACVLKGSIMKWLEQEWFGSGERWFFKKTNP